MSIRHLTLSMDSLLTPDYNGSFYELFLYCIYYIIIVFECDPDAFSNRLFNFTLFEFLGPVYPYLWISRFLKRVAVTSSACVLIFKTHSFRFLHCSESHYRCFESTLRYDDNHQSTEEYLKHLTLRWTTHWKIGNAQYQNNKIITKNVGPFDLN